MHGTLNTSELLCSFLLTSFFPEQGLKPLLLFIYFSFGLRPLNEVMERCLLLLGVGVTLSQGTFTRTHPAPGGHHGRRDPQPSNLALCTLLEAQEEGVARWPLKTSPGLCSRVGPAQVPLAPPLPGSPGEK
jgi:hypothetical protein